MGTTIFKKKRVSASCSSQVAGKYQVLVLWLILVTVTAGCAGFTGAGRYVAMSPREKKEVLESLKANWQNYDIYCDGSITVPAALIFDPKGDDRALIGYQYTKLSKEASVRTAIIWLESLSQYFPSLYRIYDEEMNFYGYVLIAHHLPVSQRVDEKTLQLPQFQSMYHIGDGAGGD